jgi:prepilin-type N-terminal cleavage/methylation domain-containing protein
MKTLLKVSQAMKSLQLIKKLKDRKGFTMVELLMVVILMLLVVTMVSSAFLLSANASEDIINLTTNEIDARVAVYRITKDLREAANISIAKDDELSFNSNVDLDEDIEVVHYYLQLHEDGYYELFRQIDGGTSDLAATCVVNTDVFAYYTAVDTPEGGLSTPVSELERADIRLIDISVAVDQSGTETVRTMKLDTLIYLRNKI